METVLKILQAALDDYKSALRNSMESFKKGVIPPLTYNMHIRNLTPKIHEFEKAIKILKKYS